MPSAKDIRIKPITAASAKRAIKRYHYSGKSVPNSQIHFGVFLDGVLLGALQFGPPIFSKVMLKLVKGLKRGELIELNRMALSDKLPKNSESRAIAVCLRLIKKHYPRIKLVLSFSDGTQCGDGTIYRAAGFSLIGIKKNNHVIKLADGTVTTDLTLGKGKHILSTGRAMPPKDATPLKGYQLKYIYFLHKNEIENLTVPVLPFSAIDEAGAGMYKGKSRTKLGNDCDLQNSGGATPTSALQSEAAA